MRFFLLLFMAGVVAATQDAAHQAGQEFITGLHQEAIRHTPQTDVIPGVTSQPPQANLDLNGNWGGAIATEQARSTAGQAITEIANTRTKFKLDLETDPLFKPVLNAELKITEETVVTSKEILCEEGGEDVTYSCHEDRVVVPQVPSKKVTVTVAHLSFHPHYVSYIECIRGGLFKHCKEIKRTRQEGYYVVLPKKIEEFRALFCPKFAQELAPNLDCRRIQGYEIKSGSRSDGVDQIKVYVPSQQITLELSHDTYEGEGIDEWGSGCAKLEEMVEAGLCHYGERVCTQGAGVREINGYQIYKEDWQYRQVYHCKMIKDECSALKARGCYQISSRCKEEKQGRCWIFEQTYKCEDQTSRKVSSQDPTKIFCFTGNCQDMSYQSNNEMLATISKMAMLKEVQDDLRTQQSSSSFFIFKGDLQKCSRNCLSFKDCCGGMKGWGIDFHLAGCSSQEKQLALRRSKSLCHMVGTYCSKKILGKCVSKKTSFCCFGNKFARALQEQGRMQLGLNWGEIKTPDCRGLTVEELARIDFGRLDLSEVFSELMAKYRASDQQGLQAKTQEKLAENMRNIEHGLKVKPIQPGVSDAPKATL